MSQLDPNSPAVQQAVADAVDTRYADILLKAARDLEHEGQRRIEHGEATTWDAAIEYLRALATGDEVSDDDLT